MYKIKRPGLIILLVLVVLIKIFSLFPQFVEKYYSAGLYPVISKTQRFLTGWIPFSVGDIFYFLAGLYLLLKTIGFIKMIIRKKISGSYLLHAGRKLLTAASVVYILFNVLWGLNYNRVGIAKQLQLKKEAVLTPDLINVMEEIVYRINTLDSSARANRSSLLKKKIFLTGRFRLITISQNRTIFSGIRWFR